MAARREAEHGVLGEQSLACLEPAEAQVLERVLERQLELAPAAGVVARIGHGRQPQAHLPHEVAPGEPEPVAPAHPHQVLDRRALELRGARRTTSPTLRNGPPCSRSATTAVAVSSLQSRIKPSPTRTALVSPFPRPSGSPLGFPATVRESFRVSRSTVHHTSLTLTSGSRISIPFRLASRPNASRE